MIATIWRFRVAAESVAACAKALRSATSAIGIRGAAIATGPV